jgi:hypothetical protein
LARRRRIIRTAHSRVSLKSNIVAALAGDQVENPNSCWRSLRESNRATRFLPSMTAYTESMGRSASALDEPIGGGPSFTGLGLPTEVASKIPTAEVYIKQGEVIARDGPKASSLQVLDQQRTHRLRLMAQAPRVASPGGTIPSHRRGSTRYRKDGENGLDLASSVAMPSNGRNTSSMLVAVCVDRLDRLSRCPRPPSSAPP